MTRIIEGKVYVVGDNIDTDQIIPASHLTYSMRDPIERLNYGRLALSGLPSDRYPIPFVKAGNESEYGIILAGRNFGCGSSREQAPAALKFSGVKAVLALSFARIFYRNAIDAAFLMPLEIKTAADDLFKTGDVASLDIENGKAVNRTTGGEISFLPLGEAQEILDIGGIFAYARKRGWVTTA